MGVGNVAGNYLSGALRNPSAADGQFARAFIGVQRTYLACALASMFSASLTSTGVSDATCGRP